MRKLVNELNLNEKVSFKDPTYGAGYILGYNKEIGKHLVGYNANCKRHANAFQNTTGQFVQNKDGKYQYSDRLRDYSHFYFVDSVLELLNTEESTDRQYGTGQQVDVQFNANGSVVPLGGVWDQTTTRRAAVVGMTDRGTPLLYMDAPMAGQAEYGMIFSPEVHRWIDARYDANLNTSRAAFVDGGTVSMGRSNKKQTTGQQPQRAVEQEKVMEHSKDNRSFWDMMKSDGKNAAVRVASQQLTSGMKTAILTFLEGKGQGSERLAAVKEMLDTKAGEAAIAYLAGNLLTFAPVISDDPRAKMLAEEFRVSGMTTIGNEVFGVAMETVLPVIQNILAQLPAAEGEVKARVGETNKAPAITAPSPEEVEHSEKKAEPKTMTVGQ